MDVADAWLDTLVEAAIRTPDGELIEANDIDKLAQAYLAAKAQVGELNAFAARVAKHLAAKTTGDAKTRRLRGEKTRIIVEMPDDAFSQPPLKEAWQAFPKYAEKYLRIGSVDPQMREYKKLVNETSEDAEFLKFKALVLSANKGPTGTPRIALENDNG